MDICDVLCKPVLIGLYSVVSVTQNVFPGYEIVFRKVLFISSKTLQLCKVDICCSYLKNLSKHSWWSAQKNIDHLCEIGEKKSKRESVQ